MNVPLPSIKQATFNMINRDTGKLLTLSTNKKSPERMTETVHKAIQEMALEFCD